MLTWFPQEISSSCVSACTRIVLTSFGVTVSEEQVRRLLQHDKYGLSLAVAQTRLASAGATIFFHLFSSMDAPSTADRLEWRGISRPDVS